MYTLNNKSGRVRLDGKLISREEAEKLPNAKKFTTPLGPCVVTAKDLAEKVALANAEKPEDLEGYEEALKAART